MRGQEQEHEWMQDKQESNPSSLFNDSEFFFPLLSSSFSPLSLFFSSLILLFFFPFSSIFLFLPFSLRMTSFFDRVCSRSASKLIFFRSFSLSSSFFLSFYFLSPLIRIQSKFLFYRYNFFYNFLEEKKN